MVLIPIMEASTVRLTVKKSILNHISLIQAEIDTLEKQQDFIQSLAEEAHSDLTLIDDHLTLFKEIMDERGLIDNISYHHAVYAEKLVVLTVANMSLHQITSDRALSIRDWQPTSSVGSDMGDFDTEESGHSLSSEGDFGGSTLLNSSGEDNKE